MLDSLEFDALSFSSDDLVHLSLEIFEQVQTSVTKVMKILMYRTRHTAGTEYADCEANCISRKVSGRRSQIMCLVGGVLYYLAPHHFLHMQHF
jgi:hypothetical protein